MGLESAIRLLSSHILTLIAIFEENNDLLKVGIIDFEKSHKSLYETSFKKLKILGMLQKDNNSLKISSIFNFFILKKDFKYFKT